jgi:putative membrane protein
MRKLAILLGSAIAFAACSTTPAPPPPVDLNNVLLAPGFLAHAGSANQYEIEAAQLALQASANPGVRNLANLIIADHTAMGQQVVAAAASAGLPPPASTLLPAEQAMLDQLRASDGGTSFDAAYLQQQVTAHQQAIRMMQNYAANGDLGALRNVAAGAVPVMLKHLSMAQQLSAAPPAPPAPPPPTSTPPAGSAGERG